MTEEKLCLYCAKKPAILYGACAECLGEQNVISAKVPRALYTAFGQYKTTNGYVTNNALVVDALNTYLGIVPGGPSQQIDTSSQYEKLIAALEAFPQYKTMLDQVKDDFEIFKLPQEVYEILPLIGEFPAEFKEILNLAINKPDELCTLVALSEETQRTLKIFEQYPDKVRKSLTVICGYLDYATKLLGLLDNNKLPKNNKQIPKKEPAQAPAPETDDTIVPLDKLLGRPITVEIGEDEEKALRCVASKGRATPQDVSGVISRQSNVASVSKAASILVGLKNKGLLEDELVSANSFKTVCFKIRRE